MTDQAPGEQLDNPYARLPRTDDLLDAAHDLQDRHGRAQVREAIRSELAQVRAQIADGSTPASPERLLAVIGERLDRTLQPGPRRVVNASGVIVHTNLGRAPLSADAVAAMVDAAGYCDLEADLASGGRGSRGSHIDGLLAQAVGAPDAMVVNNCAAALVLSLMALASGREVLVSRGHLVEIGGSFRLPDIMATSGARLVEVGTTNRTRAADYTTGADVAALLTIHPSNFVQEGFVAQPDLAAVAAVARQRGVPLIHDAGSGLLTDAGPPALASEPSMAASLQAGANLVLASGDKLLGGPQAGLIAGDAALVQRCRNHPLARALRVDKLRLAALSATVLGHLRGEAVHGLPAMAPQPDLDARVRALAAALDGATRTEQTMIGGGSAPGVGLSSMVVVLADERPERLSHALRTASPPIVARVNDGELLIDLRTVDADDDQHIRDSVVAARLALAQQAAS